jgi:hypothetical protein
MFGPGLALIVGVIHASIAFFVWWRGGMRIPNTKVMPHFLGSMVAFNVVFGMFLGVPIAVMISLFSRRLNAKYYCMAVIGVAVVLFGITGYRELSSDKPDLFDDWTVTMALVYFIAAGLAVILSKKNSTMEK